MNHNERIRRQKPFAQFLREIRSGNTSNVPLGGKDPPMILRMEVPSEQVLNHFLASHQDRVPDRELFAELFHGRTLISVKRNVWQQRTAI